MYAENADNNSAAINTICAGPLKIQGALMYIRSYMLANVLQGVDVIVGMDAMNKWG